jgi:hypothetical protein
MFRALLYRFGPSLGNFPGFIMWSASLCMAERVARLFQRSVRFLIVLSPFSGMLLVASSSCLRLSYLDRALQDGKKTHKNCGISSFWDEVCK